MTFADFQVPCGEVSSLSEPGDFSLSDNKLQGQAPHHFSHVLPKEQRAGQANAGPRFSVLAHDGLARSGRLDTAHGVVHTPAFFFCATQGTLKGLAIEPVQAMGTQILLANTYHLMLQPGADVVADMGGLHAFMGWPGPLFTDSGGYQIFSLHHGSVSDEIKGRRRGAGLSERGVHHVAQGMPCRHTTSVKVTEEGAIFRSHRDGSRQLLTPERSIDVQIKLGADFICVLDECTPLHMTKEKTYRSMQLSHRWEQRSLAAFSKNAQAHQGLYGIVQGGVYPEFRLESGAFVASQPFFGHAIGGSLGADKGQMTEVVDMALQTSALRDKPIHLLGIGDVQSVLRGVARGIDTFDCVSPTRLGRHGGALVQPHYWADAPHAYQGRDHINLWKACFRHDSRPIDQECPCWTCQRYSRAYLHHLLKAREILALTALTLHNVTFMNRFMQDVRQSIMSGTFAGVPARWLSLPQAL